MGKTEMLLLPARQAAMREIAAGIGADGQMGRADASNRIKALLKMERKSAKGSQATIDRSDHSHVKKSGMAALQNRQQTIELLTEALEALHDRNNEAAAEALVQAAACGGKKSVKAARKAPTVALYVQYLAETDLDFQAWLAAQGVKA